MKKTFGYIVLFLSVFFVGCTVKISPSEENWNPYKVGDQFSFENEVGERKTFEISEIASSTIKENVYAGNLSRKKENLVVFAKQTAPSSSEVFPLLSIQANVGSDSDLGLLFAIPNQLEANFILSISEINATSQLTIGGLVYEQVFEAATDLRVGEGVTTNYPLKLYFSKVGGFLGYDLNNGEKWRLR